MANVMFSCKFSKLLKNVAKYCNRRSAHDLVSAKYAQTLLNLPETKVSELKNGFRVATEQVDSPTSTVGVWLEAGSRFESEETNGVAHFFEHLAFKGTAQRSGQDIERAVAALGAKFDAYTQREETAFYANCLSTDVSKVVEILADVVCNPKVDEQQMERERQVILEELDQVETDLKQVTFDHLHMTAYQGTPLGKTVYGPSANIKEITKDDISFYLRNNFIAPRMVLAASGNVDHEEMLKVAEKHFSSIPLTYTGEIPDLYPCRFTGSEVRVRDDWMPLAHVAIAVDTCGINDQDVYPLMLAQKIIGKWNKTSGSSANSANQLVQNIWKGKGCESFEAFHTLYRGTGLWGCYFVMGGMVVDDFMFNLQNEWMKLCVNVTEIELVIAKNALRSELLHNASTHVNSCKDIGRQVLFLGERTPFDEVEEYIEAVTVKELKDVCLKYIYDRCPAVAGVGPIEALTDYVRVRGNMTWLRY